MKSKVTNEESADEAKRQEPQRASRGRQSQKGPG